MTTPDARRDGGCSFCRQVTDPMWISKVTALLYCDGCRRMIPRQTIDRVV